MQAYQGNSPPLYADAGPADGGSAGGPADAGDAAADGNPESADEQLRRAVLLFPVVVTRLMERLDGQVSCMLPPRARPTVCKEHCHIIGTRCCLLQTACAWLAGASSSSP